MNFRNNKGFSLPEVLVGLGLTGAVVFGGMQLIKNVQTTKKHAETQHTNQTIQKLVEGQLFSTQGCSKLQGLTVGQSFTLQQGGQSFGAGAEFGKIKITDLRFAEFLPSDEAGMNGIAKIALSMDKGDGNDSSVEIPVPVSLADNASIASCNLFERSAYTDIYKDLCSGSFGSLSAGKTCAEALALVEGMAIKSICEDLYGSAGPAKYLNGSCNLQLIHANKLCPLGKAVQRFDAQGNIVCAPLPQAQCTTWGGWTPAPASACTGTTVTQTSKCQDPGNTQTKTRTVQGTGNGASCCKTWASTWSPSTNTQCSGVKMTQTRSCLSGSTAKQTRTVSGTKASGAWTPDASNYCTTENVTQSNGCSSRTVKGTKNCTQEKWRIYCFVAGTQVTLSTGKTQSIEKLAVGDKVLTYDEKTNSMAVRPVKKVFHHRNVDSALYTFTFLNGKTVTSNHQHRFYLPDAAEYASAGRIYEEWQRDPFINVLDENGQRILITDISVSHGNVNLYNIHVDGLYDSGVEESEFNHNYFANGVLVHNEKPEWDNEYYQTKAYTCCKRPEEKPSYPRGVFCNGTAADHTAWNQCSGMSP